MHMKVLEQWSDSWNSSCQLITRSVGGSCIDLMTHPPPLTILSFIEMEDIGICSSGNGDLL